MKKILLSLFILLFNLCLLGCNTLIEYPPLSSITKEEEFISAYISSVAGDDQVKVIDFEDLKEKTFYKNIMNSNTRLTDVLPEVVPNYSLIIKSKKNNLKIHDMGILYAMYKDNWYSIQCSKEDKLLLYNYLLVEDYQTYKLTIENDSSIGLIGIKTEYKAGEKVEVKMEYDMEIDTYVFLNKELLGTLNGSNSLFFNMPEKDSILIITYSNQVIYEFSDLFGYTIEAANKIMIDEGPGSIAPPRINNVYEVLDTDEINLFLNYLNNGKFVQSKAMPGVGNKTLTIQDNNMEYKIYLTTRNELWCNGNVYKSLSEFPELNKRLIYQYYEGITTCEFSSFGEEKEIKNDYFKDIRFVSYSPKTNEIYATKFATIVIDGLSLILTSKNTFADLHGGTYIIVGDKDFSDLLEGINTQTTNVVIKKGDNVSYNIIVSQNTEYTLNELKQIIPEFEPFTLVKEDNSIFESLLIVEDITLLFKR